MVKIREIPLEMRTEIVTKFRMGVSALELEKEYGICRKTVYNLVKKKNTYGSLQNRSRSGRKMRTNKEEDCSIVKVFAENPDASPIKVAEESENIIGKHISDSTIRRRLKNYDIRTYVVRKIIDISPKNKIKRLEFAKEYIHKPKEFWQNVLWTDESSFQFKGSFGRTYMHLSKGSRQKALQPFNRFGGGSVMFWGCVTYNGYGDLIPIKETLNQSGYLDILNDHVFPSARRLFASENWILQHDNAPCHKAWLPTTFLNRVGQDVLPWPPQSPDLNIIENVWAVIKRRRTLKNGRKREETIEEVKCIWNSLEIDFVRKLVDSLPDRLQAVIDADGNLSGY